MKSILAGLLLVSWTALSQPSTPENLIPSNSGELTYCLSLTKARLLVADALRLQLVDSVNNLQAERIDLLETEKIAIYSSFTNLLKLEQEKTQYHKEISKHMESLATSFRTERDYYQKQERKQRRKKNVLTYLAAGVIVLFFAK